MDRTEKQQDSTWNRQRHHVQFEQEPDSSSTRPRRSIMEVDNIYALSFTRPVAKPKPDPTKPDFFTLLTSAYLLYNRIIDEFVKPEGISAAQFPVLIAIRRRRSPTISQLSKLLGIAPSNVTTICKLLEAQNLVTRSSDPIDGRVVHIEPTEKLEQLYERLDEAISTRNAEYGKFPADSSDSFHSQPVFEAASWLERILQQYGQEADDAEAESGWPGPRTR